MNLLVSVAGSRQKISGIRTSAAQFGEIHFIIQEEYIEPPPAPHAPPLAQDLGRECKKQGTKVVSSIFVNPKQFAAHEDLGGLLTDHGSRKRGGREREREREKRRGKGKGEGKEKAKEMEREQRRERKRGRGRDRGRERER